MHQAGLPAGVFNVITGTGEGAGQALAEHPLVRKIAFTGSTPTGKKLMAIAAGDLKRTTLELGGSDPMIVCDDANLDKAASAASVGRFFNCGQACRRKRLYVFERGRRVHREARWQGPKLRVGPGTAEGVMLGPLHSARQRDLLEEQVADAVDSGAEVLHGAKRPEGDGFEKGYFYEPTLLLSPLETRGWRRRRSSDPRSPSGESRAWRRRSRSRTARSTGWDLRSGRPTSTGLPTPPSAWRPGTPGSIPPARLRRAALRRLEAVGLWQEHGIEALDFYTETKSVVVKRAVATGEGPRAQQLGGSESVSQR